MHIVFEGSDAVGKSTQISRLAKTFESNGKQVLITVEPSEDIWGKIIREKTKTKALPDADTLAAWFSRDRWRHINSVIIPALRSKKVVIQDRYYLSTLAYQAVDDDILNRIINHSRFFCPEPDVWIILERKAENANESIKQRDMQDGFETPEFQINARSRYYTVSKLCAAPVIWQQVYEGDPDRVQIEIWNKIKGLVQN